MKTLKLKPQHESSILGQLLSLKSQIDYQNKNILSEIPFMEKWEAKEYSKVISDTNQEFVSKKSYLSENESAFNIILNDYNLSVSVFVAKFLN